ncbi:MAG: hypothetical protein MK102_13205 [Fuerstiella sp.]|nr:hypothetical protein [Fuerstiella sp.]
MSETNPLAVVTLSSIRQAREKFQTLFEIAGHPKTANDITTRIDQATDNLFGIDQTLPGGVAVYLDSIFPPVFEFVAFVPISDTDAFMQTLELGPVVASQVAGAAGRYELVGPTQTSQVRVQNGYAFIQLPVMDPDQDFERPLFEPVGLLRKHTNAFDLSLTLDVDSIPKATRNLLLSFLTSTMSTLMQQRDEEADGLYEIRRAWMQADIDTLNLLLDECRQMTIGLSVDTERHLANVDFLIDIREGSTLLNEIFNSTAEPSYFAPILNDNAAFSLSISQILSDRNRKRGIGVLEGVKKELARQVDVKNLGPELDETSPVVAGLTALQDTFKKGHLDAFGQCYTDEDGNPVVIASVRVRHGETIAAGLNDILSRLQGQHNLETLRINIAEHAGIRFHRIGFSESERGRVGFPGSNNGLVFGCGSRSFWLGLGGEQTIHVVSSVIDQLQAAYEQPAQRAHSSNIRLIVNISQLIQLIETARVTNSADATVSDRTDKEPDTVTPGDRNSRQRNGRRQFSATRRARRTAWRKSFAEGGDRIRIDYHPTKNGVRFRVEFGEAFLKGIGRAITVTRQPLDAG